MSGRVFYVQDATSARYGVMDCGTCGKPIKVGQYRVKDTPEAYITHHRDCVSMDPMWANLDEDEEQARLLTREQLVDAKAFRDRWSVSDLDELIDALTERATATQP